MFGGLIALVNALFLSGLAGYVSILGMAALFPGGGMIVKAMMATLEVGKLVVTTWLHANWANKLVSKLHKGYMLCAILVLMALTSMGIYGYLSKSHLEAEAPSAGIELKISQIQQRIDQTKADRQRLDDRQKQLDQQISTSLTVAKNARDANSANKIQATQKKERDDLRNQMSAKDAEINTLTDQITPLKLQNSDVEAKLGPVKYVAQLFGWKDPNNAVNMIIMMIMFAFDPLAIVLVLSATISFGAWSERRRAKKEAKLALKAPSPVQADLPKINVQVGELPPVAPIENPLWEDYIFPRGGQGRGSLVTELPKGVALGHKAWDGNQWSPTDGIGETLVAHEPIKPTLTIAVEPEAAPASIETVFQELSQVIGSSPVVSNEETQDDPPHESSDISEDAPPISVISEPKPALPEGSSIVGVTNLPSALKVSYTPDASNAYGATQPLTASVTGSTWTITDPKLLSAIAPKSDKEMLVDILERNQGLLNEVVETVHESLAQGKSDADVAKQEAPQAGKGWLSEPWFPTP